MTDEKYIGKYFQNVDGVILITNRRNADIYDYMDCDFDDDGNIISSDRFGYITPGELKHYTEW